jgi:hypothetical protein
MDFPHQLPLWLVKSPPWQTRDDSVEDDPEKSNPLTKLKKDSNVKIADKVRWMVAFLLFISIRDGSIQCKSTSRITSHNHVQYHCSLRTSSAAQEVLGRLGDGITTEFHDDATSGLSTDGDVEIKERPP